MDSYARGVFEILAFDFDLSALGFIENFDNLEGQVVEIDACVSAWDTEDGGDSVVTVILIHDFVLSKAFRFCRFTCQTGREHVDHSFGLALGLLSWFVVGEDESWTATKQLVDKLREVDSGVFGTVIA